MISNQETDQLSPFALVEGKPIYDCPQDLYIPPDALKVILEGFQGPLDLLLYLIRKHNLDILNIPIAQVTHQYLEYIKLMQAMRWELAAEYLFMAAWLAEIKSRLLLPKPPIENDSVEEDPRAELARRLLEYEQFKIAAENIDLLPRVERDIFPIVLAQPSDDTPKPQPVITVNDLTTALQTLIQRLAIYEHHQITKEPISVQERMQFILNHLSIEKVINVNYFYQNKEGRLGIIVNILAVLELAKAKMIEIIQTDDYSPVYIKKINLEITG